MVFGGLGTGVWRVGVTGSVGVSGVWRLLLKPLVNVGRMFSCIVERKIRISVLLPNQALSSSSWPCHDSTFNRPASAPSVCPWQLHQINDESYHYIPFLEDKHSIFPRHLFNATSAHHPHILTWSRKFNESSKKVTEKSHTKLKLKNVQTTEKISNQGLPQKKCPYYHDHQRPPISIQMC